MQQEQGVLVPPSAEVPVVEGEMVTAIRELTNRGWGAKAIAVELAIARNTVRRYQRGAVAGGLATDHGDCCPLAAESGSDSQCASEHWL